jgi:ankyrin repeat protein
MSMGEEDRFTYFEDRILMAEPKDLENLLSEIEVGVDAPDFARRTLLHYVVKDVKFVELLVESQGANVNAADLFGETILHKAAYSGHLDVVEYVVRFGAYLNAQNKQGNTPLHCAASHNELAVVKYLIDRPTIEVNLSNRSGKTALDKARMFGETAKFLIEHGAVSGKLGVVRG